MRLLSSVGCVFLVTGALAQVRHTTRPASTAPATTQSSDDPVARIRDEGLNHSQVMQTLSYLTEVIGPRLTGSPNLRRANQ